MKEQLLRAALIHFEGEALKARANLEVYLNSAAGVGDHNDVVKEVISLTQQITTAEDNHRTLEEMIVQEFHGELNG